MNKCYASIQEYSKYTTTFLNNFYFAPFLLWNDHNDKYFEKMKKHNIMDNDDDAIENLKITFFSLENMDIIQYNIIKHVYFGSNETLRIKKIKNESLIQVMNYIWYNFCDFIPKELKQQLIQLNKYTINYIVPLLLKESEFYFNYLKDSNRTQRQINFDRGIDTTKRKNDLPSYIK